MAAPSLLFGGLSRDIMYNSSVMFYFAYSLRPAREMAIERAYRGKCGRTALLGACRVSSTPIAGDVNAPVTLLVKSEHQRQADRSDISRHR